MRKSNSYVTTLDVNSATDMQTLETIKATIRAVNAYGQDKKRVVLRGRKPIVKGRSVNYWSGKVRYGGFDRAGNIVGGIQNASKLDVYIYDKR